MISPSSFSIPTTGARLTPRRLTEAAKTDILIRVLDHNAFVGGKWWSGPKALEEALKQLFGYLTARDTRAALIFYRPSTRDLTATIEKARKSIEARDEFVEWNESDDNFEMQCRMHAPGDEARVVTVTSMFVHLPRPS